jgi:phosphoribosylanthranilate isomerase
MRAMTRVKICGLTSESDVDSAIRAGADLIGLVLFHRSPRHVDNALAARLAGQARGRVGVVTLLVDPDDSEVETVRSLIRPDLIQLHGRETPERVWAIGEAAGVRVIKSIGVAEPADLAQADAFAPVCDRLLIDARPAADDTRPGGLGRRFDWRMLQAYPRAADILLAGGLTPDTVAEAIAIAHPWGVDVSSGVESAPGIKDPDKMQAFIAAAKAAD